MKLKREIKPTKMWMVRGSSGGLAPFYGCSFSRKALLKEFQVNGWTMHPDMKIVRVIVTAAR
jgi:hypothetical protein